MGLDKFYKNSAILTLSNFITGFIGFAFSIVLSKKLGAEGLGLYGLLCLYILC
jgi:stage V sporulation protein B